MPNVPMNISCDDNEVASSSIYLSTIHQWIYHIIINEEVHWS